MSLRTNVIANYLGHGWTAVMGLAFVPLYIRVLGPEAYGLVGVYTVLQAAMTLLDLGMTPTLNREMARLRAGLHSAATIRDLLRSLEVLCAALALALVAVVWFGAGWLADSWLNTQHLSRQTVTGALQVMGFVLAARWIEQVYRSALQGLDDMVWLNVAQAVLATLRWGGALLVLQLMSATITAFFAWQFTVALLTLVLLAGRTYGRLPLTSTAPRFRLASLYEIRHYAGGMFLSSLLGFLLVQMDKIVISKVLPLQQLGYYTLASLGASSFITLIAPMNNAVLPRLTELAARDDTAALQRVYLRSCEWMAALLVPLALVVVFFAESVLMLWTGDPGLSRAVAPILSMLTFGTLLSGFMNLPYMLQLANGWTSLSLKINLVSICVVLPGILLLVPRFGGQGAAFVWIALNTVYVLLGIQLMHRRLLPDSKWHWYRRAFLAPLVVGTCAGAVLQLALPRWPTREFAAVPILAALLVLVPCVWLAIPTVRQALGNRLHQMAVRLNIRRGQVTPPSAVLNDYTDRRNHSPRTTS